MAQVGTRDGDQICMAARDGDLSHVSALLARGVAPDARESQFGSTPLHWSGQARQPTAARKGAARRSPSAPDGAAAACCRRFGGWRGAQGPWQ